jgi:4-hydroxybenzoate polyprenyltransferase
MSEATGVRARPGSLLTQIRPFIRTMRPKQYTKNVFVWAALIFDRKLLEPEPLVRTAVAFVLFCLISSAVYIINDIVDRDKDRQHPQKMHRPLAAGTLALPVAVAGAVVIVLGSLPVAWIVVPEIVALLYGYLVLMLAYSFWLKHIVIVDVLVLSLGFVLRVGGGVVAADAANFSPWLYVCMLLLALFLGLGKRRQEIILLKEHNGTTRSILSEYNVRFLDEMLALVTSTTVMAYSLYTFSGDNLPPNHTMMLTIPFVLYGLFRYLYLIHVRGETDPPDQVILKDRPLQIDVLLFGLFVFAVFYVLPGISTAV